MFLEFQYLALLSGDFFSGCVLLRYTKTFVLRYYWRAAWDVCGLSGQRRPGYGGSVRTRAKRGSAAGAGVGGGTTVRCVRSQFLRRTTIASGE